VGPVTSSVLAVFPQHAEDSAPNLANPTKQVTTIAPGMKKDIGRTQDMVSRSRFEDVRYRAPEFCVQSGLLDLAEPRGCRRCRAGCMRACLLAFDTFASAGARAWILAIVRNVAFTALAANEELSLGNC